MGRDLFSRSQALPGNAFIEALPQEPHKRVNWRQSLPISITRQSLVTRIKSSCPLCLCGFSLLFSRFQYSRYFSFFSQVVEIYHRDTESTERFLGSCRGVARNRGKKPGFYKTCSLVAKVDVNYPVSGVLVSGVLPWGGALSIAC